MLFNNSLPSSLVFLPLTDIPSPPSPLPHQNQLKLRLNHEKQENSIYLDRLRTGGRVGVKDEPEIKSKRKSNSCATVEEMGKDFKGGFWEESLRVRKLIQHHFDLNASYFECGICDSSYRTFEGWKLIRLIQFQPEVLHFRPNVFGEMMRVLTTPSEDVEDAINWFFSGVEPDISLHMRMLMNKSIRAAQAALNCIRKAKQNLGKSPRPRVVIVSDTPPLVKNITPNINKFAEVIHFDYELFKGNISDSRKGMHSLDFGMKDWGPAPGWIAFVDFFLASRAKYAGASADHRRVGTTYAQLIAALAAANNPGDKPTGSNFAFLSSFQDWLGACVEQICRSPCPLAPLPLGCHNQPNQCPFTQLLPPAWWDGLWQFPLPRDIKKLAEYGIQLSRFGTIDENYLDTFCSTRKVVVKTVPFLL
ncbi:hypothetical protein Prudu_305S000100 [Prunus dulcis]|uniref:Uncharacterized protein n=1 Tax=Prunus dulcis TaxID=3755 RepID=A0A5H2XLR1_PRUDU|nr:hypothetical protein Prudu_305S000100 [Prunus dulcis]